MFYDGVEISPVGRDENGIGVWWGEQKIALAAPPLLTKNSDNLPFQRMTSTEDRYLLWKRVMVGNLSSDRLTEFNHDCLMARVAARISDKRVLKLTRAFLNAGVMEDGLVVPVDEGTPQGGPLSPLLSNLMLDDLDKELTRRGHRFCRYADDCAPRRREEEALM